MARFLEQREVDQLGDYLSRMCRESLGPELPIQSIEFKRSDEDARPHEFKVHVSPEHVGLLVGKGGRTVNAMQGLLTVAARQRGCDARFRVTVEGRDGERDGSGERSARR